MTAVTEVDLVAADEVGSWEFPSDFAYRDLKRRVLLAKEALEAQLGRKLDYEGGSHIQDASFSFSLTLRTQSVGKHTYACAIRFSNFSRFAAVTDETYEACEEYLEVIKILEACGFRVVSHDLLERPYPEKLGGEEITWWVRYFDYL